MDIESLISKTASQKAMLTPEECKCHMTRLLHDVSLPIEQSVGVCEICHDVPYKIKWGSMPDSRIVYNRNVTSGQSYPQVIVTKKSTANQFEKLIVRVELFDDDVYHELSGFVEKSVKCEDVKEMIVFNFNKLKIMTTSQKNNGKHFYLIFKLFGEKKSQQWYLGCLESLPIIVYSHKNILPARTE
jgi:hypothetical protein